ncbi:hypothetical protein BXY82_0802 [Gelidibacter sediminis]|uniref:Uncharacterized protein n=1 Tax=Gelidibacter sediminis TaxID=1608710 RepID=A0A4R7Q954_9FLAO|nr:hypothetical protein BXY82_0802 [Gelidibacter sediminis]
MRKQNKIYLYISNKANSKGFAFFFALDGEFWAK